MSEGGRRRSAAGFAYHCELQLHYPQGGGWDIIDCVKNGSKFVTGKVGWGPFSLCCHKGSLIVMFMYANVSQSSLRSLLCVQQTACIIGETGGPACVGLLESRVLQSPSLCPQHSVPRAL